MTRRTRHLYVARHAEPGSDGDSLSRRGTRQAALLGRRLADVPFAAVHHGPLPRASATAHAVARQLTSAVPVQALDAAGDYVPYLPSRSEMLDQHADRVLAHLGDVPVDEARSGAALAADALRQLTGPVVGDGGDRHELVITHAFTVGWLVRDALGAPAWRWWGLNHCHTGLTVIRYFPDKPPSLVVVNDQAHLPPDLQWTGFPEEYRVPAP